jgi:hypothetical protein
MDAEKRRAVCRRRIIFSAHLLLFVIARLVIGSPPQMPRTTVYEGYFFWGVLVFVHWLLLAYFDARDRTPLPFRWLNRLVMPRERRWLLLIIDVMLWFTSQAGVAGLLFSSYYNYLLMRYETPIALLWALQTLVMLTHLALATYTEINQRVVATKRKNDAKAKTVLPADGELVDFPAVEDATGVAAVKHELRHD